MAWYEVTVAGLGHPFETDTDGRVIGIIEARALVHAETAEDAALEARLYFGRMERVEITAIEIK